MAEAGAQRSDRNQLCRLDGTHAVRVTAVGPGHRAEPVTLVDDAWRRSVPGDGTGLALLRRLRNRNAFEEGFRVTVVSPVGETEGTERTMGVDQTNESWVVGDRIVVKWVTDELDGPHPAPDRLRRLAAAGFTQTPALYGLVEWRQPDGQWAPVAVAQAYVRDTEDGWTWAVEEARRSLGIVPGDARPFAADLGAVTGRMHLALADDPLGGLDARLAQAQAEDARAATDLAVRLTADADPASHDLLVAHRARIEGDLAPLDGLAGSPAVHVHGDFHVGQVLRTPGGELFVIDFDGNPTRPAALRAAPGSAARDVAGMLVSLENVGHVVRRYAPEVSGDSVGGWTDRVQAEFLAAYVDALGSRRELYDESLVPAFVCEQVCREFVYAARHLPRWAYVPAAALRRRDASGEEA